MANLKKIKKDLLKLSPEELKETLDFLVDEEEVKPEVKEEPEEVVKQEVKKEVVKVEPKVEEKKTLGITKEDLEEMFKQFTDKFVTKEEVDVVKADVEKVSKKAKPFGVVTKPEKADVKEEINLQDYLDKVNSKFA